MEVKSKSLVVNQMNIKIKPPYSILITWDDLPGFILEFPYYSFMCNKLFDIRKKDTIRMAMSKMTGLYKHTLYGYTLTDTTRPNIPRLYWNYEGDFKESKIGIYNFMMETLRMNIVPRLNQIPKL